MPVLTTIAVTAGTAAAKAAAERRKAVQRGEKEALADIYRRKRDKWRENRDSRDDEDDDSEIGVDPELIAKVAESAIKAAKYVAQLKRERDEAIANGEEPLISDEEIKEAALRAKSKMKKARALKEADETQKRAKKKIRSRVGFDGSRPNDYDPELGGAMVWGVDSPRKSRNKPNMRGVSAYDPRIGEGSVQLHMDPMKLKEASEILLALTRINISQMQQGVPPLSHGVGEGHIRYMRRPEGTVFTTLRGLYQQGGGDCGPLAAAYAAERTVAGHPSIPYLYYARPGVIHAVVRDIKTGDLYDPSRMAGMGKE